MINENSKGTNSVLAVILSVAVTVSLVGLVSLTVFDITGDVSNSADAAIEFESQVGEKDIKATVLRNENVEQLTIRYQVLKEVDGGADKWVIKDTTLSGRPEAGQSFMARKDNSDNIGVTSTRNALSTEEYGDLRQSGRAVLVASLSDGSKDVISTLDYDFSDG